MNATFTKPLTATKRVLCLLVHETNHAGIVLHYDIIHTLKHCFTWRKMMDEIHVDKWKPSLSLCYTGVLRPDSIQFLLEPVEESKTQCYTGFLCSEINHSHKTVCMLPFLHLFFKESHFLLESCN